MKKIKNYITKLFSLFLLILVSIIPTMIIKAQENNLEKIVIHYYRFDQDYSKWALWLWPENGTGNEYKFDGEDDFGVTYTIEYSESAFSKTASIGILIKDGSWNKDIANDRFIDLTKATSNILNIYLVEGDSRIGYFLNDPNGPEKTDKLKTVYFKTEKIIAYTSTQKLSKDNIKVFKNDTLLDAVVNSNGFSGTITLNENVDLNSTYVVKATFSDGVEKTYNVTFDGIYDSSAFERAFGYDGNDLGVTIDSDSTSFRVWAPIASNMKLNLYSTGTPKSLGGTDVPDEIIEMKKDVKGTWVHVINQNLHGKYYTYTVTNSSTTAEVVDPYAKGTGINGLRGLIIDFSKVNPKGWEYNNRANNIKSSTDAIIYELHVRDLTSHSSWNGKQENRARFLGLCEEGTKYQNVSTGFDHIKELGVTHVQLLPIFDYGYVDESRLTDPKYLDGVGEGYSWGYMPMNYNSLEGGYSSDPFDGLKSVIEMKQVIMKYTEANIRINMDVVYNHTGQTADSNFNILVPGYYYRMDASGNFSNGSGCGNETASERYMMSKFIVDSVMFWAKEYNLGGFRFDLMALHDTNTMNKVANELKNLDPTIMIYGEPWNGGTTPLDPSKAADKMNLANMPNVGAFNDDIRDGIKGSVFDAKATGFVQGNIENYEKVKYGIVGGINHPQVNYSSISYQKAWNKEPTKSINYVACHDNNTLYDKLMQSLSTSQKKNIELYQKQANAIVLLSQGISFIHAGDEIMRSKPLDGGKFDHNSYQSPDSVNQIRWDQKIKEKELNVFNYYKGLISLRKNHPAFRMTNSNDIKNNLKFIDTKDGNVIAYTISNNANSDKFENILVIFNTSNKVKYLTLPNTNKWQLIVNNNLAQEEKISTHNGNDNFILLPNSTNVLTTYIEEEIKPAKKGCFGTVLVSTILSFAAVGCGLFVYLNKKEH